MVTKKIKYLQSQLFINGCHCTTAVLINQDLFRHWLKILCFFFNITKKENTASNVPPPMIVVCLFVLGFHTQGVNLPDDHDHNCVIH